MTVEGDDFIMKKYIFIALILIFGTSILSNYMTYKKFHIETKTSENTNIQNNI